MRLTDESARLGSCPETALRSEADTELGEGPVPVASGVSEIGLLGSATRPERAVAHQCGPGAPNLEGNGEIELPADLALSYAIA